MAMPEGGLQPLIGFAMQALGREGATVASVAEQMRRIAPERGWPVGLIDRSIEWAITNRQATLAATTIDRNTSLAIILGTEGEPGETVGVRVVLTIISDRGGVGRHQETVSVVVNVPSNWTPDQAETFARALWASQAANLPSGDQLVEILPGPGIVAVFEGGYESGISP